MSLRVLERPGHAESEALSELCEQDLQAVEELLWNGVRSSAYVPRDLARELVRAGGKRIRPYLTCLSYRSFDGQKHKSRVTPRELHTLAAVSEWVHTATLFHDDVLDASPVRRDKPSAHILHGNKTAILVGDFVYAEAFALLMDAGLLDPSRELASTIKTVVEGELLQHKVATERSVDFGDYTRICRAKTAALFGWCTETGCWAAGSELYPLAGDFGIRLGEAFQMADDLFDTFSIDPRTATPEILTEWIESSAPLPVVLAAEEDPRVQSLWSDLALNQSVESKRTLVREILSFCRRETVVGRCLQNIRALLDEARDFQARLGDNPLLLHALELIQTRADLGAQSAKEAVKAGSPAPTQQA